MNAIDDRLRRIVAATDLSEPARDAAERAARLADESGATLTLLHVLAQGPLDDLRDWLGAPLMEQVHTLAARDLAALAGELERVAGGTAQTRLERGSLLPTICRVADELDAELLVLGARGAGALRRLLLGATAERLLRLTTRPVLVVRTPSHQPYRRALIALDFSRWSDAILAQARRLAPKAHWCLCHVFKVPFERELRFAAVDEQTISYYREEARAKAMSRLQALADNCGLPPTQRDLYAVEGDPALRLIEQQQALGCDLTVIGKHGQGAAEELLLGGVTKHVAAESSADVLVVAEAAHGRST